MKQKKAFAYLVLGAVTLFIAVSSASASSDSRRINQEGCPPPDILQEDGSCYYPPEDPPPPEETAVPVPDSPPLESPWNGYTDGRLNPDMAEYYSVYCDSDYLMVWGASATNAQLISAISIQLLIDGPWPFDGGNGLTVYREGDTVTISGANGYGPNHPGSKLFSMSECIARNGGAPPVQTTEEAAPPQNEGDSQNPAAPSDCENQFYYFSHLDECERCDVSFYEANHQFECRHIVDTLILIAYLLCANPVMGVAAIGSFGTFRIRRKRK